MNSKEVSTTLDISIDTMRYYERIGIIPPVARNHNGYRDYKNSDLNWIFSMKMLRKAGVSIEHLVEFADLMQTAGNNVQSKQKEILKAQLKEIDEKVEMLQTTRNLLNYKIETFDEHVSKFETGEWTNEKSENLWEIKHSKDSNDK